MGPWRTSKTERKAMERASPEFAGRLPTAQRSEIC